MEGDPIPVEQRVVVVRLDTHVPTNCAANLVDQVAQGPTPVQQIHAKMAALAVPVPGQQFVNVRVDGPEARVRHKSPLTVPLTRVRMVVPAQTLVLRIVVSVHRLGRVLHARHRLHKLTAICVVLKPQCVSLTTTITASILKGITLLL